MLIILPACFNIEPIKSDDIDLILDGKFEFTQEVYKEPDESQRWIQPDIALSNDPDFKINCPKCQKAFLEIEDVNSELDENLFERIMKSFIFRKQFQQVKNISSEWLQIIYRYPFLFSRLFPRKVVYH